MKLEKSTQHLCLIAAGILAVSTLFSPLAVNICRADDANVDKPAFPSYGSASGTQAINSRAATANSALSEAKTPPWEQKSSISTLREGPGGRDKGFPINLDVDSPAFPAAPITSGGYQSENSGSDGTSLDETLESSPARATEISKDGLTLFPNSLKRAMELKKLEKRPVFPQGPEKDIASMGPVDSLGKLLRERPYIPSLPAYCGGFDGFTARRMSTLIGMPFQEDERLLQESPRVPLELRPGRPVDGQGRYLNGTGPETSHPEIPQVPSGS